MTQDTKTNTKGYFQFLKNTDIVSLVKNLKEYTNNNIREPFTRRRSHIVDLCNRSFNELNQSVNELIDSFQDTFLRDKSTSVTKFNIGLFGPSRIGKTTMLAAMVEEFKKYSDDIQQNNSVYLKLSPSDRITAEKLNDRINMLKAGIQDGAFQVGTLLGTGEHEIFNLRFEDGRDRKFGQNFTLHDFPGGWINDPDEMQKLGFEDWDVCIIPIDATVVMECGDQQERSIARNLLAIQQVEDFVRDWANNRITKQSLCILCPVKSETYFAEPAMERGQRARSEELRQKITGEFYNEILELLAKFDNVRVYYMPVNTIGCCYLKSCKWDRNSGFTGDFAISSLPNMQRWLPYGPVNVMFEICHFMAQKITIAQNQGDAEKNFLRAKDIFSYSLKKKNYNRKLIIQA